MNPFGIPHALHYCSGARAGPAGSPSFRDLASSLARGQRLEEGSPEFDEYRSAALADAERAILLGASHYRRVLDLLTPIAAPWGLVTAYYGAFYCAIGILHMFGCAALGRLYVEVAVASPGAQELRVGETSRLGLTSSGTHQQFWEIFYRVAARIEPNVDPLLRFALRPIGAAATALATTRNEVNYHTHRALELARDFGARFDRTTFPQTLPPVFGTQYQILEGLLEISLQFRRDFDLTVGNTSLYLGPGDLSNHIRDHVYHTAPPPLVRRTSKGRLLSI